MSQELYEQQLDVITTEGKRLTKWELDFIANIEQRVSEKRPLTRSQAEHLKRIYEERT